MKSIELPESEWRQVLQALQIRVAMLKSKGFGPDHPHFSETERALSQVAARVESQTLYVPER